MQLGLAVDSVDLADDISSIYLIASLYIHHLQLAVECKVISMSYQNTLIISRHHKDLLHYTFEYTFDICSLRHGDIDTIVWRKFKILVDRVILFSETSYHWTVNRPRQLALVLGELPVQLIIDLLLRLSGTARLLHSLSNDSLDFLIERIHLLLLVCKLLLVSLLVLLQILHHLVCLGFFCFQGFKVLHTLILDYLGLLLQFRQLVLFNFQGRLCFLDLLRLIIHLIGKILEIRITPESLSQILAGKHIHVPYS